MLKGLVVFANAVLVLFTLVVIGTDGPPSNAIYSAFTALLIGVPVFTMLALLWGGAGGGVRRLAAVCNLVLVACVVLALVDQYPHPKEPGVVEFVTLCLAAPVLSALALLRRRSGRRPVPTV